MDLITCRKFYTSNCPVRRTRGPGTRPCIHMAYGYHIWFLHVLYLFPYQSRYPTQLPSNGNINWHSSAAGGTGQVFLLKKKKKIWISGAGGKLFKFRGICVKNLALYGADQQVSAKPSLNHLSSLKNYDSTEREGNGSNLCGWVVACPSPGIPCIPSHQDLGIRKGKNKCQHRTSHIAHRTPCGKC